MRLCGVVTILVACGTCSSQLSRRTWHLIEKEWERNNKIVYCITITEKPFRKNWREKQFLIKRLINWI
jgi:hypothetical protein